MKKLLIVAAVLTSWGLAKAQYAPVVYDQERRTLNDGMPLPAEKKWMITGTVPPYIKLVEVRVFDRPVMKKALHTSQWEHSEQSQDHRFVVTIDELLKGNSEYTFELMFFEPVNKAVTDALIEEVAANLHLYVSENVELKRGKASVLKPTRQMMEELNTIVEKGMANYRTYLGSSYPGFSQIVEDKIDKLNQTKLNMAKFNMLSKDDESKADKKINYGQQQIDALKELLTAELRTQLDQEQLIMRDRDVLTDVSTEKVMNIVALNLGYGGIYNSGDVDGLSYSQAPFLGLSIPLGRFALTSKILSNSSLSAGLFLNNVTDEDDRTITGPLVQRPLYLAYGYKVFRMVRLNVGGSLLQRDDVRPDGSEKSVIYGRPFVGVSLEINLWMGLGR